MTRFLRLSTITFFLPLLAPAPALRAGPADSLQLLLLRHPQADTVRINLLHELGAYYVYKPYELKVDLDSALLYLQEAHHLSQRLRKEEKIRKSQWLLGYCRFERKEAKAGREAFAPIIQYYQQQKSKAELADCLWQMGNRLQRNDSTYEVAVDYLRQSMQLYEELGEQEKSITALKQIADMHLNQGKLKESEEELLQVIDRYKAIGYTNLHYTYDLLAAVSTLRGNLNRALYFALEMIKSMEATGDNGSAAIFYDRLARIYEGLGQWEKSVAWYKKSFDANEFTDYTICLNVARNLIFLGRPEEALTFIRQVISTDPPRQFLDKALIAQTFGLCYQALDRYELAERYFLDMIHFEKIPQHQNAYTSTVNLTMGEFYVSRGRYREAAPYLHNVLAIAPGIVTAQELGNVHLLLFQVDSAAGNYLSAIRHFQRHKMLNDSLFNETKSRQIEELQIQYETANKERDIAALKNERELQESRLLRVNMTKNLTFGGLVLLLVFIGLLYGRYRMKQRINRQLEIQQIEINQTNNSLQQLLKEKEWLLREIHHRVKNNLQIVMSLLNTQSLYLENDAALTAIRDSQHRIHSISLLHQKLYQSKNLALIDMSTYIQELAHYLRDSFDADDRIRFDLQIDPIELDVNYAVPLGLILNEAVSNAIKYAFPDQRPGRIRVHLRETGPDHFELVIADNGIGLPEDFSLPTSNSLGMSLMEGLSKQLEGTFELRSQQGLTIRINFVGKPISTEMALLP